MLAAAGTVRLSVLAGDMRAALDPAVLARRSGFEPFGKQMTALRSREKQQILNWSRQSGKSTTTAYIIAHEAIYNPGGLTLILSSSERQSRLTLEKVKKVSAGKAPGASVYDVDNQLYVRFPNGSEIYALPGKDGTVRGFSGVSLIVIDEASRVADSLYFAVRPMLAATLGRLILLSSPFGKRGFFHDVWERGGPEWQKTKMTAYEVPHFDAAFLEKERRSMPPEWFAQEYLGEFIETNDQLFGSDLVDSLVKADIAPLFGGGGRDPWDNVLTSVTPL